MKYIISVLLVALLVSSHSLAQTGSGEGETNSIATPLPVETPMLGLYPEQPPWFWNNAWRPDWFYSGMRFPIFNWLNLIPNGYWQCTAFNGYLQSFSYFGWDMNQAGYGALYSCGGSYYMNMGCYIPPGYCRLQ